MSKLRAHTLTSGTRWGSESRSTKVLHVLYLGVVCAHGACALLWAPGVALMRVWVGVILHFIVPGLDMKSWRPIPEEEKTV